jgi:hypothetical protein
MKLTFTPHLIAIFLTFSAGIATFDAKAQSEAPAVSALSVLPVASVVVGASAVAGAVLVVKAVQSTARGTVYVLERASDGARASVELVGQGITSTALVAGASVVVSVVSTGVVLSAAGEAVAFVPNALGRALLHNERLTY